MFAPGLPTYLQCAMPCHAMLCYSTLLSALLGLSDVTMEDFHVRREVGWEDFHFVSTTQTITWPWDGMEFGVQTSGGCHAQQSTRLKQTPSPFESPGMF